MDEMSARQPGKRIRRQSNIKRVVFGAQFVALCAGTSFQNWDVKTWQL